MDSERAESLGVSSSENAEIHAGTGGDEVSEVR